MAPPTAPPAASAFRIALGVFAGLVTVVALSSFTDALLHARRVFPAPGQPMGSSLWVLATAYRAAFTFVGGWIAARVQGDGSMRAAWILTIAGLVLGLTGVGFAASHPGLGPMWYAWAVALTGPPCSWLGGRVAAAGLARGATR